MVFLQATRNIDHRDSFNVELTAEERKASPRLWSDFLTDLLSCPFNICQRDPEPPAAVGRSVSRSIRGFNFANLPLPGSQRPAAAGVYWSGGSHPGFGKPLTGEGCDVIKLSVAGCLVSDGVNKHKGAQPLAGVADPSN